jgi:hypothetical protein
MLSSKPRPSPWQSSFRLNGLIAARAPRRRNDRHRTARRSRLPDFGIDMRRRADHAARARQLVAEISRRVALLGIGFAALPCRARRIRRRAGFWVELLCHGRHRCLCRRRRLGHRHSRQQRNQQTKNAGSTCHCTLPFQRQLPQDNGFAGGRVPFRSRGRPDAQSGSTKNGQAAASAGVRPGVRRHDVGPNRPAGQNGIPAASRACGR